MAPTERASVQKMGRKKFVVQQWRGVNGRSGGLPTGSYSAPHAGLLQSKAKRKMEKINEKNELKNYTLV